MVDGVLGELMHLRAGGIRASTLKFDLQLPDSFLSRMPDARSM